MYDTDIKGKRIIYYENCLELDGVTIYYRDMEHITQAFEEQPVFRFGYRGRDIRIPCREDEYQDVLEYWIKAAEQSPTTDTVAFLDSAKQKKEDDSRLDSFTESKENRYSGSSRTGGNTYNYNFYGGSSSTGNSDWYGSNTEGVRHINKFIFVVVCNFLFGVVGVDRFVRGQFLLGLVKLFTGGLGGILYFIDLVVAIVKAFSVYGDTDELHFNADGSYTR